VKVLVLTASAEPNDLFRALGVGALGYVPKTASPSEIVDALHQVDQDWVVASPAMAPRFMADSIQPPEKGAGVTEIDTQLTAREQDVLKLVASGMSNAAIRRRPQRVREHCENPRQESARQASYEEPRRSRGLCFQARIYWVSDNLRPLPIFDHLDQPTSSRFS